MLKTVKPKVRVGLVGVSGFAENHLQSLLAEEAEGRLQLTCATIINQREVAAVCRDLRGRGCRVYDDFEAMLEAERGRLDLCIIPTGINLHRWMTIAALRASCHVLVEKPAAGSIEDVDAMIAARNEADRRVFVGFQSLYQDTTTEIKTRILAGEIGDLEQIRIMACWPRPVEYYRRNKWAGRLKVGGDWVYDSPANNALAHFVMDALYFSGKEVDAVASVAEFEANLFRIQPIDSFDTISTRFQTETGVRVLYHVTHSSSRVVEPVMEIGGSRGSIRLEARKLITVHPSGETIPILDSASARRAMYRRSLALMAGGSSQYPGSLESVRAHTSFINRLHAQCPIQTVPDDWVQTAQKAEDMTQRFIPGIESAIERCFSGNRLMTMEDLAPDRP